VSYSAWDTSGPSAIAEAFYQPGHGKTRGKAPNLAPRERVKPIKVKIKPEKLWRRVMDVEAIREYIAKGHTAEQAAKYFRHSEKTIRRNIGSVLAIRRKIPGHKKHSEICKFTAYLLPDAMEWVRANGGSEFLRKLVAQAMEAQA